MRSVLLLSCLALMAACGGSETPAAANAPAAPDNASTSPTAADVLAPAASGGPVDVRPLAGQAEAGIEAMLGAPTACEDVPQGRRCRYARGRSEGVFINGMADWITVGALGDAPFASDSITKLGIGPAAPASTGADAIRWNDLAGMKQVVVYPRGDRVDRVEIHAMTP